MPGNKLCNTGNNYATKIHKKEHSGNKKVKYYLCKTEQKQAVSEQVKIYLLSDTKLTKNIPQYFICSYFPCNLPKVVQYFSYVLCNEVRRKCGVEAQ